MSTVVGVVFSAGGQVVPCETDGVELAWNERVICRTARGLEYGRVVVPNRRPTKEELGQQLRTVVRRATPEDEAQRRAQRERADAALRAFRRRVRELGLPIKVHTSDMLFDGSRVTVLFGADDRTDLRGVAQEVGRAVGVRIDARQVGPRDGARLTGGVGMCGDQLCCTRFPSHENPITLRMAKEQDLPMNPGRITGLCGRLRCCLAFEHPVYKRFRDRAPAVGRQVQTPHGRGVVRAFKVPEDSVLVRVEGHDRDLLVRLDDLA